MKNKKELILGTVFLCSEFLLWILIIFKSAGPIYQFSSVLLAVIFSFVFIKRTPESISTSIALAFTALADLCLVIADPIKQISGMLFFSAVQLAYAVRIYNEEDLQERKKLHFYTRIGAVALLEALMLIVLGSKSDLLSLITMFYFANLITNTLLALLSRKSYPFIIGLFLFMCCDIFVGLDVLISDYISVSENSLLYQITHLGFDTVWLFYVPSQTLIALSSQKN